MDKNKKIIVGVIFAITALLATLSIYVSWELRRDISPDESAADTAPTATAVVIEPTQDIDKDKTPTKVPPTKVPPTKVPPTEVPPTKIPPTLAPTTVTGGGEVTPLPSGPLPSTDLVDERTDALILGSLLIIMGVVLYKKYLNFGDKHAR